MLAASPKRLARRLLTIVLVVFYGCSDPSAPVSPRVELRGPSLDVLVLKVTNTDDSGAGSLRQAVFDAIATPGAVIQFDASLAGKTILLTSGEMDVGTPMTIEGPGATGITVSAGLNSRIFQIGADGDLTLRNISIVNGREDSGGAAELLDRAKLTLDHALVANNEARSRGGAVFVNQGTTLTIINSTVSGNVAGIAGGGIQGSGAVTLRNATVAYNINGGIDLGSRGDFSLRNSIIAHNSGGNCLLDPDASVIHSGLNLSDDSTCGTDASMVIGDGSLDPLANNGGPTMTHAIRASSEAIDRGTLCSETTDQRYVTRNQGSSCDIGAFEFNDFGTFTFVIGPNIAVSARTGVATVTGTITCSKPGLVTAGVTLRQTQKITGRFTTIIEGSSGLNVASCGPTPSSWTVPVTAISGKFANGTATGSVTTVTIPFGFLQNTTSATVKVFLTR